MKRLIEKHKNKFLREDGSQAYCLAITIPFSEIPIDLDLTGYTVSPMNVIYDDCHVMIRNFDGHSNHIILEVPQWIRHSLGVAYINGIERSAELSNKLAYESSCIKGKVPIGYDNTVA